MNLQCGVSQLWTATEQTTPAPPPAPALGSRQDRDAHVRELAAQFEPDSEPGF